MVSNMTNGIQQYSRVEFTADIGFGEKVVAFVDFNSQGISFGIPQHVIITEGTPEDKTLGKAVIDVYQRITVHRDGKIVTHWPIAPGQNISTVWDTQRESLKLWGEPWSMRQELIWNDTYLAVSRSYFNTKPKIDSRTLRIPVEYVKDCKESVVIFFIAKPGDVGKLQAKLSKDIHSWVIADGWPWVMVCMSNTVNATSEIINNAGRNYRPD